MEKLEEVGMKYLYIKNQQREDKNSQENILPKCGQVFVMPVLLSDIIPG